MSWADAIAVMKEALNEKIRPEDRISNAEAFRTQMNQAEVWFDDPSPDAVFVGTAHIAIGLARSWPRPEVLIPAVCSKVLERHGYNVRMSINPHASGEASQVIPLAISRQTQPLADLLQDLCS